MIVSRMGKMASGWVGLSLVCAWLGGAPAARAGEPLLDRARELTRRAFVFDAHCDTAMRLLDDGVDLGQRSKEGHLDIPRMREGGLDAQVFALWVDPDHWPDHAIHRTLDLLDAVLGAVARHPADLALALSAADARRIRAQGKMAVFLGIEGGQAIEDDLASLRMVHRLGVRLMTLTWMSNTNWADSANDDPQHHGLTPFGRKVVAEMNRLGMVIDVSHASDETVRDVLETSSQPVLASHSCCRALCPIPRNLSDELIRALAKKGGVVAINYFVGFLDPEAWKVSEALWAKLEPLYQKHKDDLPTYRKLKAPLVAAAEKQLPRVDIERLVDHIDHAVKVAGIDHVALGSDFDGISWTPRGLEDVSRMPRLTAALLARGYSEADVAKILGGNLLSLFERVLDR